MFDSGYCETGDPGTIYAGTKPDVSQPAMSTLDFQAFAIEIDELRKIAEELKQSCEIHKDPMF